MNNLKIPNDLRINLDKAEDYEIEEFCEKLIPYIPKFRKQNTRALHLIFDEKLSFIYHRINAKAALRGEPTQMFILKVLLLNSLDLENTELKDVSKLKKIRGERK